MIETHRLNGVNRDLPPSELPIEVFTDLKNMRYNDAAMSKFDGHTLVFSGILHSPYYALGVRYPLDYFWLYPGASAIGVVDTTGTHSDITPVSGVSATYEDNWTGGIINGVGYLSNPGDDPLYWDGSVSTAMQVFPGWPANTKAKCIRTYRNFLIALNLTESSVNFPNKIKWSSSADAGNIPQSWDETDPTLEAGEVILAGTQGEIVDCLPLYDDNIIYKDNSAFVMSFTGGQQIFAFRELFNDIGVIGKNCIAQFKGKHVVFTQDDLIVHDGRTPQSIVDKRLRTWLFRELNSQHVMKSFVVPYHRCDEIWFCFPNASVGADGLPNQAVVWNYKDDKHSIRDLQDAPFIAPGVISQSNAVADWDSDADSWDSDTSIWNENQIGNVAHHLLMCSGGGLHQVDVGTTFNGADYRCYVERLSMPLSENYSEIKLLKTLWLNIEGTPGLVLKIRVGGQMHRDDPVSWGMEKPFVVGTDDRFNSYIKGRFLSFIISSDTGEKWTLHGIGFESKTTGRY